VKKVAIRAVWFFLCGGDGYTVLFGVFNEKCAGVQVPFPPGGDDFYARHEGLVGELKAHLIIALAGGSVAHRVCAGFLGYLYLVFGDKGPGKGGAQKVLALVDGVCAEGGKDKIPNKFLFQILDEHLAGSGFKGLGLNRVKLLALSDVGAEGHHFAVKGFDEPFEDDRGIQPAGICQNNLFDVFCHGHCS
jgi:hypothetical protein